MSAISLTTADAVDLSPVKSVWSMAEDQIVQRLTAIPTERHHITQTSLKLAFAGYIQSVKV